MPTILVPPAHRRTNVPLGGSISSLALPSACTRHFLARVGKIARQDFSSVFSASLDGAAMDV